jgi:Ca-activated chloride channel family protein
MRRREFVLSLAALLATRRVRAQRPVETNQRFRLGTELVPTAVTVRDGEGRLVTSLLRDDFEVAEDGVTQPVTQFTKERIPVSVALALDCSDSMRGARMDDARSAVQNFLEHLLKPEDETALVFFNHEARVAESWSRDRESIGGLLRGVRPTGATAIYDAVAAALPLFADRLHPRAALVVVSDGADTASDTAITTLKQKLVREDIFLYAVGIASPTVRGPSRINPQVLRELAGSSGGYAEIIGSTAEIAGATERIAEELNNQYMLGYTPAAPGDGRSYRAIRVRVKRQEYNVRARRGVVR